MTTPGVVGAGLAPPGASVICSQTLSLHQRHHSRFSVAVLDFYIT